MTGTKDTIIVSLLVLTVMFLLISTLTQRSGQIRNKCVLLLLLLLLFSSCALLLALAAVWLCPRGWYW